MSAADIAVQAFRKLEPQDFKILLAIESSMSRYEYVPRDAISRLSEFTQRELDYRLCRLNQLSLIRRWVGPYTGYTLNTAGYDCLSINALVKANVLEAFGKPLGVGKEADVYRALTQDGKQVAVKFHRLGRTSFRQTKRKCGYIANRHHVSWLQQSRLASKKEFEALKLLYPQGVAVPEPIQQNRHIVVIGMIEGTELFHYVEIPNSQKVFNEILFHVRKAFLEAGVIHADLSEFNVILKPDWHILIIDWPQFVKCNHPNYDQLLKRDVRNIVRFFQRKHGLNVKLREALTYVKGA